MKKYLGFVLPCLFAFSVYAQPLLVEENESTENEKSVSSEQAELKKETSAENNETTENSVTEDLSEVNKNAVPDAKQGENTIPDENQDESMNQEIQPKPVEYLPNPSNFSADFMASLYQCQPNREQQNLSGYEEISIVGKVDNRCRLLYDDFVLSVPSELLPNIHSMDDIRQLLQNKDIARYQPKYEYSGLLQELNICGKSQNVGTAQFCNAKKKQKCPYNGNTGETKWTTIELKLSFNNSFSYRKHTVSVKGNWRDRCDDKNYSDKIWDIQNTLHGFIYPTNLDISKIGYDVKFTWEYSGSETDETRKGKWVLYRIENGKCVKQVEDTSPFTKHFTIADKDFRCLATYYLTFQPNALNETTIIAGLTKGYTKGSHTPFEGVCTVCKHGIFSYTTTDGKTTPLASNMDFGSKILSHTIDSKGTCIIEFEGKFTRIPDRAFLNTKMNNSTIQIPNTVTSIGSYAFSNTAISGSLLIPSSVTEIGEGAFKNCRSITDLSLPSNLKRIGNSVFYACGFVGKLTIPNSVTEIGDYAFYDCNSLNKDLILSENLKKIGSYAFARCTKFSEGNLTIPNSVTEIGDGAFSNCSSFNSLTLSNKLTKIGNQAFMNCHSLSGNLTIPNSVTEIGDEAFSYCRGFNGNLTLPNNLKTIRKKAFNGCNSLNGNLTIPNSVTEIGEGAFLNCSGFNADLILPEKLKTIGANAFNGCYRLQKEQIVLPTTLESIGSGAFNETGMLNRIIYQSLPQGIENNFFKSGMSIYKNVSLSDESYIKDLTSNIIVSGASYSRTMSNTWGTIILPYSLKLTGDEPYSLYAIDHITADELVLRRISEYVNAGTAYLVRRDGEQQTLNFTDSKQSRLIKNIYTTIVAGGLNFRGTYHAQEVTDGYIIRNGLLWDVAKLKAASPQTEAIMVGPFRSWLDGTITNSAAKLSIRVDDSATGIDNPISSLNADDVEYYDLNGRRLTAPQQGINIMKRGNKTMKVIIK